MIKAIVILTICCINLAVLETQDGSHHWGYKKDNEKKQDVLPSDWHNHHKKCSGRKQSPINVVFGNTQYDSSLKELSIKQTDSNNDVKEQWSVKNNGKTIKFLTNKNYRFQMKSELYEFRQMHFHWRGSEHRVNGRKFSGELHLVHQSLNNTKMHAVVGFMFEIVDYDNPNLNVLVERLKEIRESDASVTIEDLSLSHLVPLNLHDYYRYSGSLTTPGCDEVVEWILMDSPVIGISEDQLLEFQSLRDKHGYPILSNSRPVQQLNGRQVKRSFYSSSSNTRQSGDSASGFNKAQSLKAGMLNLIAFLFLAIF